MRHALLPLLGAALGCASADADRDTAPAPALSGAVVPGEWGYTHDHVELLSDPCGWAAVLEPAGGLTAFMPTGFAVSVTADTFTIAARRHGGSFGAEEPAACALDERGRFTCAPQPIAPRDGFLGAYGWRYRVTFTGRATTPRRLDGTAIVEFSSVDPDTDEMLRAVGIDFGDCTQLLGLSLQHTR